MVHALGPTCFIGQMLDKFYSSIVVTFAEKYTKMLQMPIESSVRFST